MEPILRAARPEEAAALSALALRSKAHWGYSADFLEAARAELTLAADALEGVVVATVGEQLGGFRKLVIAGAAAELDMLFVDPPFIGTGLGRLLLDDALAVARAAGVERVALDADPDAEAFYARRGARTIGTAPSGSIPGRELPRMEFEL